MRKRFVVSAALLSCLALAAPAALAQQQPYDPKKKPPQGQATSTKPPQGMTQQQGMTGQQQGMKSTQQQQGKPTTGQGQQTGQGVMPGASPLVTYQSGAGSP